MMIMNDGDGGDEDYDDDDYDDEYVSMRHRCPIPATGAGF